MKVDNDQMVFEMPQYNYNWTPVPTLSAVQSFAAATGAVLTACGLVLKMWQEERITNGEALFALCSILDATKAPAPTAQPEPSFGIGGAQPVPGSVMYVDGPFPIGTTQGW